MSGESKELELLPISKMFIEAGGFRGRLALRDVMSYDDVIAEVIKNNFLWMEPHTLKMILEETLETIRTPQCRCDAAGDHQSQLVRLLAQGLDGAARVDPRGEQQPVRASALVSRLTVVITM